MACHLRLFVIWAANAQSSSKLSSARELGQNEFTCRPAEKNPTRNTTPKTEIKVACNKKYLLELTGGSFEADGHNPLAPRLHPPQPLQVRVSTLGKILEDCPKLVSKREHYEMNNRAILMVPDARTGQDRKGQVRPDNQGAPTALPGVACVWLVRREKMLHEQGKRDGELRLPSVMMHSCTQTPHALSFSHSLALTLTQTFGYGAC